MNAAGVLLPLGILPVAGHRANLQVVNEKTG
jgi:hypothetical protein